MARIRSVSPELRTSETCAAWPRETRYAWVLLWGYLDDYGRGLDNARVIASDLFPLDDDVTHKTMADWLDLFAESGSICRYEVDGKRYLHCLNWREYQKPQHPGKVRVPPCPIHEADAHSSWSEAHGRPSENTHEGLMSVSPTSKEGEEEKEVEKEREAPPANASPPTPFIDHCETHRYLAIPPACGQCKETRENNKRLGIKPAVLHLVKPSLPPWCGNCNGPRDRHRETPVGVIRCPECNPMAEVG